MASFITIVFDMNMLVLFRVLTSFVGDFLFTKTSHLMNFTIRSECLVEIRADLHWNILHQFLTVSYYVFQFTKYVHTNFHLWVKMTLHNFIYPILILHNWSHANNLTLLLGFSSYPHSFMHSHLGSFDSGSTFKIRARIL